MRPAGTTRPCPTVISSSEVSDAQAKKPATAAAISSTKPRNNHGAPRSRSALTAVGTSRLRGRGSGKFSATAGGSSAAVSRQSCQLDAHVASDSAAGRLARRSLV